MGPRKGKGAAPDGGGAPHVDQLAGRIDGNHTDLRRGVQAISTPLEAVEAMVAAGAVFAVEQRGFVLGMAFTYRMQPGGDIERARAILAAVKAKPPAFLSAFKSIVQEVAGRSHDPGE